MDLMEPTEAEQKGYAKFNSGPHLCVDVPDGHFTITCKNSQGKQVTLAFMPNVVGDKKGHQCMDVMYHHDNDKNESGLPVQNLIVFGQGGNAFSTNKQPEDTPDCDRPTLTTVLLYGKDREPFREAV